VTSNSAQVAIERVGHPSRDVEMIMRHEEDNAEEIPHKETVLAAINHASLRGP